MAASRKLSIKRRRRGLIFADLLRCAATAAPDEELKRDVLRLAGSVERRFGFSDAEKRKHVIDAVFDGARTVMDLVVETGFNPQDVNRFLKELEAAGRVKLDRISIHGTGRPSILIIPIGAQTIDLQ
jgi:hypothetical protein